VFLGFVIQLPFFGNNKIFSGYWPCQVVKRRRNQRFKDHLLRVLIGILRTRTDMVLISILRTRTDGTDKYPEDENTDRTDQYREDEDRWY
jgi:hypothetical protein